MHRAIFLNNTPGQVAFPPLCAGLPRPDPVGEEIGRRGDHQETEDGIEPAARV
jgi:hypothetical protein